MTAAPDVAVAGAAQVPVHALGDTRVIRQRLLSLMSTSPVRPIVMLSAPAGAGKSTVAAQLLSVDTRAHAWVSLTHVSDEPAVLAGLLLDALETIGPGVPATRASVTAFEPGFSGVLLASLTRLAASRTSAYVLVVDDVHLLSHPQCHQLLAAVAEGVPAGSAMVLCSRHRTPDWLARARAEGLLLELTGDDLAFTVDEAAQLFQRLDVQISDASIAGIVDRSGGWAVGMYLTGLAMQREGPSAEGPGGPRGESGSHIRAYLRAEVLGEMSPTERSFLTRTAILDDLEPALCNAVLGRADAAAMLTGLRRRTQLISVSSDGRRFRCHHLLREVLLAELATNEPEFELIGHRRASGWYAEHGDLDAAIRHATSAGDVPAVATLVWSGIVECVGSGQPDRLLMWLGGLSDHQIAADRWLSLAAAWAAASSGRPDDMTRWLLSAHGHAGRDWRERMATDEYAASLAVLETMVGAGGLRDMVELAEGALQGLPADSAFRSAAGWLRGAALTLLRRPEAARVALVEAEQLARALGVPQVQADALSWQGMLAVMSGEPTRAAQLVAPVTRLVEENHLDRLAYSAHCITGLAVMRAVTHSPDTRDTLAAALRLTALIPQLAPWFAVCGRLAQAHVAIRLGDGALARVLINDARHAMTPDLAASIAGDLLESTDASLRQLSRDGVSGAALTAAEMRVLQFLPSHLTFPAIGEHLFLSRNTVKSHAMAIYRKLGVDSRAGAVEAAQSLGLVQVPPSE
jgi:LuxR family maltose regulon positive regulatory protein